MELIFIRHGEPVAIESPDGTPADPHLSARGEWQAERVCHWLSCEPIDAVVTSNKRRAQQTVAALAEHHRVAPTVIADLDEIDRHCPVYAPFQMLSSRFPEVWEKVLQQRWEEINGVNRTHFCGAYWGFGFHEDGVKSALAVCEPLGRSL